MIKILGIDPGYDRCGVSIVGGTKSKPELLFSTCIVTDRKAEFIDRIKQIYIELGDIIEKWSPTEASVEDIFFTKNLKTAVKVSEARGVILLTCAILNLKVSEYTPLQIKSTLTGYGKAEKSQVDFIVKNILKLKNEKKMDDEMDAIAAGITHLFIRKT